jgi:carotenoid cleavage dioxygenase
MHCDIERLKAGGNHWQWYPERPYYLGILPRRGAKSSDIRVDFVYPQMKTSQC